MRQVAADGTARADSRVADPAHGLIKQWQLFSHSAVALDGRVAGHRANGQTTVPGGDIGKARDAVQIDQTGRSHQSEVEQGNEALTTGQDLGLTVGVGQLVDRFVERAGRDVFKRRRLHGRLAQILLGLRTPSAPNEQVRSEITIAIDEVVLIERSARA